jgi:hypothetical protein
VTANRDLVGGSLFGTGGVADHHPTRSGYAPENDDQQPLGKPLHLTR